MEATPLGPILMIPGLKEAIAGAGGLDAESGAFKAGGYVWDAISVVAAGTGAGRVAAEKGAAEGGSESILVHNCDDLALGFQKKYLPGLRKISAPDSLVWLKKGSARDIGGLWWKGCWAAGKERCMSI
ncbi:hypothetical protein E1293_34690 [Actinomadura darangshiensis]|uniref:Uncharacterized protein n=1 Tax=Actinomadura darangshiensis TaxID=705336 RepID=A0A4R5AG27_9ACTN|nr:hypothetical protein [Actinomadura darangshiensis]TDD70565.1 hypothetical protein E1293_34690 [Actinomadura darangshiensis]